MAQTPRVPDLEAQRAAIKKLAYLIGQWSGEARVLRRPDQPLELNLTEEAQYKMDGLLLMIEALGRKTTDGGIALQALGIISYDDESATYRMRTYNDGRYLETEVKCMDACKELSWGFVLGDIRTNSSLRVSEKGEWTELHEITVGSQAPRKFMELTVRRKK
jgi:hypothetical protein